MKKLLRFLKPRVRVQFNKHVDGWGIEVRWKKDVK